MPPTRTATARRTLHTPSQGASTPGRTRLQVRRARLARPTDEDRSSTPRRISVPRSAAAAHMHDLCALEAQRMQAKQEQERSTQEERLQRARTVDEQLMEERRVAKENRPPPSSWHTYQDYEMKLLCAEYEQTVSQLRAELEERDTELARLRLAADQHHQAESQLTTSVHEWKTRVAQLEEQLHSHDDRTHELRREADEARALVRNLEMRLIDADALRRRLHNQVQELRGNVRVYARIRPSLQDGAVAEWHFPDAAMLATQMEVRVPTESATGTASVKTHAFTFDHVFPPASTQADVFAEVADLLQSVLDGYHTTIFAYGQTGSGKTHTLEGGAGIDWDHQHAGMNDDPNVGLIPRAMHMLWRVAEAQRIHGWSYTFEASMVEVYLDQVSDLLGDEPGKGKGRAHGKDKCEIKHLPTHTHIEHAVVAPMTRPNDVYALLAQAKKRRQVAATLMNERSSRSHSVFALRVCGEHASGTKTDATLNLVDLAGSERLASSGSANDAQRLREAQSINRSLSCLADVISALASNAKHVPYRNSTLTWLLKPSLSRGAKTYVLHDGMRVFFFSPMPDKLLITPILTHEQTHVTCVVPIGSASVRNTVFSALCNTGPWHASRSSYANAYGTALLGV